jgi:hypothetical protein
VKKLVPKIERFIKSASDGYGISIFNDDEKQQQECLCSRLSKEQGESNILRDLTCDNYIREMRGSGQ